MNRPITNYEARQEVKALHRERRCYACLRHAPESDTSTFVYAVELGGWLCVATCLKRANAVRCKPIEGKAGPGRTRPLWEWLALLRAMRPTTGAQA